jgi:hypothetical protein
LAVSLSSNTWGDRKWYSSMTMSIFFSKPPSSSVL